MYQFWILDPLSLFYVIPLFIVRLFIHFMRQVHKICTQFPPLVAFLFRYSSTKSFKGKTSCRIRIAYICSGIIDICVFLANCLHTFTKYYKWTLCLLTFVFFAFFLFSTRPLFFGSSTILYFLKFTSFLLTLSL